MLLPPTVILSGKRYGSRSRDQPVYLVRPREARGIRRNCIFMPLVFDLREQAIRTITLGPNQNIAPIKRLQGNWPRSALAVVNGLLLGTFR
jgi:hypothetical protein